MQTQPTFRAMIGSFDLKTRQGKIKLAPSTEELWLENTLVKGKQVGVRITTLDGDSFTRTIQFPLAKYPDPEALNLFGNVQIGPQYFFSFVAGPEVYSSLQDHDVLKTNDVRTSPSQVQEALEHFTSRIIDSRT